MSVRVRPSIHARVVLACEDLNMTVTEWLERSILASLARQEEGKKIERYELACTAAEKLNELTPLPRDYGLPDDFLFTPGATDPGRPRSPGR